MHSVSLVRICSVTCSWLHWRCLGSAVRKRYNTGPFSFAIILVESILSVYALLRSHRVCASLSRRVLRGPA
ncbi:hypothetical protein CPB86DRAFT_491011 [Serendipita vermifera]|nr:hypothetical protein CPB86DRAFT_491011 [Serendipita vermifera]